MKKTNTTRKKSVKNKYKGGAFQMITNLFNTQENKTKMSNTTNNIGQIISIAYKGTAKKCYICDSNKYLKTLGAIEKSKLQNAVVNQVFGDIGSIINDTSIVNYTCMVCGYCQIFRSDYFQSNKYELLEESPFVNPVIENKPEPQPIENI